MTLEMTGKTMSFPASHTGRTLRRTLASGMTAAILVLGTTGLATPASAATADCPSGYSCFWGDTGYRTDSVENRLVRFYQCYRDLETATWSGTSSAANDRASSVSNKGQHDPAYYYVDARYRGLFFPLPYGSGDGNLGDSSGNAPASFNDKISSARFASFDTDCE
ncbi:peptidase inhibitor family I36 protein [Cellulomonas oligotrophica]|uniref:Peptidase inhibitor family I36 n=1 Tax=Cellulomonas oligotrophica TaxID=931536 RepID=A0A7Y9JZT5_9CELL|nr:peptidase inhibitor family I36 protein [Cellulomonas oligotrophica]NYD86585.1 hypothetical protein [Cellulomonas oligotrophica]GIG32525.1 hypothetical protein Col01nite_16840 [Cellulomonas oligotrophica]